MIQLSLDEFDQAYQIMKKAFPKSELRPYKKMKQFLEEEILSFYGIYDKKDLNAIIIVWEFEEFVFLENFAVSKKVRGKGLGSQLLKEIQENFHKLIVLEVEEPFDEMSRRRIGFYERNGFLLSDYGYLQPPLNEEINNIPLQIMSYPKRIRSDEFQKIKNTIFKRVFECSEKI